jgi:hypothetical protein
MKARAHKPRRMQHPPPPPPPPPPLAPLSDMFKAATDKYSKFDDDGYASFPPVLSHPPPPTATHYGAELTCAWRPEAAHTSVC